MNNDLRPINTIPNFKRFCMTIGELPTSYLETMTYYEMLVWFTEYMKNTIIPTINNNGLAVEELQNKYIELKSYVDNYFTNLDVQQEINNKLDEMVTNGTLDEIINQQIFSNLNEQINQNTNNINQLQELTKNLPSDENNIKNLQNFNQFKNQPLQYGKLKLPNEFNNINFNLYRDIDNKIYDDLDLSNYDTNNIIYVDFDNGSDETGSESNPFKTVKGALNYINTLNGNYYKIICKTYRFCRNEFYDEGLTSNEYTMLKSVVIEPEDMNKRILVSIDQRNLIWSNQGNGVWKTSRSKVLDVYNLKNKDVYGMYEKFIKVNTLEECQNINKTWYISGSDLYIHSNEEPTIDKYLIKLALPIISFNIHNNNFLRLKNIDFYVANKILFKNDTTNFENSLICENVNIFGCANANGFNIDNIKKAYLLNCKTGDNLRDGFNYHYTNIPVSSMNNAIVYEINCVSFNNGLNDTNNTNNCSTIHEHGRIIRCNCLYQNSKKVCIADINSPKVLMINCSVNQQFNDSTYIGYQFQDDDSQDGIAYLIDCKCLTKRNLNIEGTNNFKVRLKNFDGNYENNDLDIQQYNEYSTGIN